VAYVSPSRRGACTGCGCEIQLSSTGAIAPYCRQCHRDGLVPLTHGTGGYKRGCRCAECKLAKRNLMRIYVAAVRVRDGISPTQKIRGGGPSKPCPDCGKLIRPRKASIYCGRCGARRRHAQYNRYIPDDRRRAVHERDGWVCWICNEPTDPTADSNSAQYPTLDHIEPQSLTLIPDHSERNLRTAHRGCNARRGAPLDFAKAVA